MALLPGLDPFAELNSIHRTMDRLFNSALGSEQGTTGSGRPSMYIPVNVRESESSYEVEAPIPGLRPEDVSVTFADGVLTIRAEHKEEQRTEQGQTLRREFFRGDSIRQLGLSGEIDPERIEATIENGILTVLVPKAAKAQPRRIPIGAKGSDKSEPKLVGSSDS
jgi:HSP20 family protein